VEGNQIQLVKKPMEGAGKSLGAEVTKGRFSGEMKGNLKRTEEKIGLGRSGTRKL